MLAFHVHTVHGGLGSKSLRSCKENRPEDCGFSKTSMPPDRNAFAKLTSVKKDRVARNHPHVKIWTKMMMGRWHGGEENVGDVRWDSH